MTTKMLAVSMYDYINTYGYWVKDSTVTISASGIDIPSGKKITIKLPVSGKSILQLTCIHSYQYWKGDVTTVYMDSTSKTYNYTDKNGNTRSTVYWMPVREVVEGEGGYSYQRQMKNCTSTSHGTSVTETASVDYIDFNGIYLYAYGGYTTRITDILIEYYG